MDNTRPTRATDVAYLRQLAQIIPDSTPPARLRHLQSRYANVDDPMIAALPTTYRAAVESRLRALLTTSQVMEPAR